MRGDKNGGDGGANPQRTFNRQGAAGLLRRQAQQGQPKPHGSGGAGGGEGVAHPGQQLRGHARAVVPDGKGDGLPLLRQGDVQAPGLGGDGILGDIQQLTSCLNVRQIPAP